MVLVCPDIPIYFIVGYSQTFPILTTHLAAPYCKFVSVMHPLQRV